MHIKTGDNDSLPTTYIIREKREGHLKAGDVSPKREEGRAP